MPATLNSDFFVILPLVLRFLCHFYLIRTFFVKSTSRNHFLEYAMLTNQ